ncbi:hypothetical protein ACWPKO_11520 [Coraliomargarita sp. W4R53]
MKKGTKDFFKLIAVFSGLAVLAFGLLVAVTWRSAPKIEKHVSSVEWLPREASDISYVETEGFGWYRFTEFTISETELRNFAEENEWNLVEKENVLMGARSLLNEPPLRELHGDPADYIPTALVYEDRQSNGGGTTLTYDLESSRAYLHTSHR